MIAYQERRVRADSAERVVEIHASAYTRVATKNFGKQPVGAWRALGIKHRPKTLHGLRWECRHHQRAILTPDGKQILGQIGRAEMTAVEMLAGGSMCKVAPGSIPAQRKNAVKTTASRMKGHPPAGSDRADRAAFCGLI